jgi:alpha-tubulin suppressor-like RCC1 family protein
MGNGLLFAMGVCVFACAAQAITTTNLPSFPIVQVWGGGRHTMALLSDGSVWTWGSDVSGKLGDNNVSPSYNVTNNDSFYPQRVHGPGNVGYLNGIIAISAGEGHNMALMSNGTVWTWGWNGVAQLGDGTTNDAHTPVQVSGLSNIVAISGRGYHCLALRRDGTVWSWGWNVWGQLGINSTATTLVPVQVMQLTNPATISAGYMVSVALMSNGTVQVWGTGPKGELGQGSFTDHSYLPEQVKGLSNVVSVSADFQEPEALKSDGTIWMWGWNNLGQLGIGNESDTNIPTQVLNLTNMIFAGQTGDRDNCAIRADHTVWTWGRNYNGQLGIGTNDMDPHPIPVQMPPFGNGYVVMVQTPDWHSLALESDGTLWGWGANDHGQLGNGTTNEADSPTLVQWPLVPAAAGTRLAGVKMGGSGGFQISFTNNLGSRFSMLMSTNPAAPLTNWTVLGTVTEPAPGQFQFTDTGAGTGPARFYCVRSPF